MSIKNLIALKKQKRVAIFYFFHSLNCQMETEGSHITHNAQACFRRAYFACKNTTERNKPFGNTVLREVRKRVFKWRERLSVKRNRAVKHASAMPEAKRISLDGNCFMQC